MSPFLQILKQYWGFDSFRGIQLDIIQSIFEGKDTLGLMPTGGGKSVTFQVPSLAMPGICIVVTPLIALMKDQVYHLRKKGIKAVAVYAGMSHDQIITALENCIFGDYKFLYVSPERLSSVLFQSKLRHMNVNFITIDEAHCISQWGYDFRPSYLEVADVRKLLPGKPVLALTATATKKVVKDIQNKLQFQKHNVFRMSFERKNLTYLVTKTENKYQEALNILKGTTGPVIIYTRSRKKTGEIAQWLKDNGISALHYHAGMDNADRDIRQNMWQEESVRVIVATNAFGMGIDKSNVRLVIHMDAPDSPEAYFQEAGRAGRDGQPAQAILLYNGSDHNRLLKRIEEKFPPKDYIRGVYNDLCSFYQLAIGDGQNVTYEFNEINFCTNFHYFPVSLESAIQLLTKTGLISYREEEDSKSRIMFLLNKNELYRLHHLPATAEKVINFVLRNYGGVFSEYVYLEEKDIAVHTNLTPDTVYSILKALNQQHVLHYIPRKNTPYITFNTRRVETQEIVLSADIYEDRKGEYRQRIQAMLDYATNEDVCRSRILLKYFEEEDIHDCGQCDVCQQHTGRKARIQNIEKVAEAILQLLNEKENVTIEDVNNLPYSTVIIHDALQWLVDEEEVCCKDGVLIIP